MRKPPSCQDLAPLLARFLDGELSPAAQERVQEHLTACPACAGELRDLAQVISALDESLTELPAPAGFTAQVMERVRARGEWRGWRVWWARLEPARLLGGALGGVALALSLALLIFHPWNPTVSPVELQILGQAQWLCASPASVRVIASHLGTNQPLRNARIHLSLVGGWRRHTLYIGQTNERGTVDTHFQLPPTFGPGEYRLAVEARSRFGREELSKPIRLRRAYHLRLTPDKPRYRPGETIHLRTWTLERGTQRPPQEQTITLTLEDPRGRQVARTTQAINPFGVATADFELAPEAQPGDYTVRAQVAETEAAQVVRVERYEEPKFRVGLELEKPFYRPGEALRATVQARYFFGQPVANARVTVRFFTGEASLVREQVGRTNANGLFTFEQGLPRQAFGPALEQGRAQVRLQVSVVDAAGQVGRLDRWLPVSAQPLRIEAIPESGGLVAGVPNLIYLIIGSPDGQPAPGAVEVVPLTDAGRPRWDRMERLTTDESGVAVYSFTPAAARHTLEITARTADGEEVTVRRELKVGSEPLLLRPEKALYRPGETVRLTVLAPQGNETVFVDVAPEGQIALTKSLSLQQGRGELTLDLPSRLSGRLELQAYPRLTGPWRRSLGGPPRDTRLIYVAPPDALRIALEPDQEEYRPGEEATVRLTVTDAAGQPRPASLAVYLLDEATLETSPRKRLPLEPLFRALDEPSGGPTPTKRPSPLPSPVAMEASPSLGQALLAAVGEPQMVYDRLFSSSPGKQVRAARLQARFFQAARIAALGSLCFLLLLIPAALVLWIGGVSPREELLGSWLRKLGGMGLLLGLGGLGGGLILARFEFGPAVASAVPAALLILALLTGLTRFGRHPEGPRGLTRTLATLTGWLLLANVCRPFLAPVGKARLIPTVHLSGQPYAASLSAVPSRKKSSQPTPAAAEAGRDREEGRGGKLGNGETGKLDLISRFPNFPALPFPPFPSAFTAPNVITDEAGKAQLKVPLTGAITTWRLTAFGSSADGEWGDEQRELRVFQDFFVDLDLPATLTQGDEISVPVTLANYLDRPQKVRLTVIREPWFTLTEPAEREVNLPANERVVEFFPLRAEQVGQHVLTLHADSAATPGVPGVAIRREVQVEPAQREFRKAFYGRLEGSVTRTITIPAEASDGLSRVEVQVYPDLFSQVQEGLDGLERSANGAEAASLYARLGADLEPAPPPPPEFQARARRAVNRGYQILLSQEVAGGGFSDTGRAPADLLRSAQSLAWLREMARVWEVDPALLERTEKWLRARRTSDGVWKPPAGVLADWPEENERTLAVTALVTWMFLEGKDQKAPALERSLSYLQERSRRAADAYTLALCANALVAAEPDEPTSQQVLERLIELRRTDHQGASWPVDRSTLTGARGEAATLETTALAAQALLRAEPFSEVAEAAVSFLLQERGPDGTWGSPSATFQALRALALALEKTDPKRIRGLVVVEANGQQAGELRFARQDQSQPKSVEVSPPLHEGHNKITLTFKGRGEPWYRIVSQYYWPWADRPAPAGPEIELQVDYERPELAPGEKLPCQVRVRNRRPQPTGEVRVDVGVPPGCAVSEEALQRELPPAVRQFKPDGPRLTFRLKPLSPAEEIRFRFHLQARLPAVVQTPPSRAYEVANPRGETVVGPVKIVVRVR